MKGLSIDRVIKKCNFEFRKTFCHKGKRMLLSSTSLKCIDFFELTFFPSGVMELDQDSTPIDDDYLYEIYDLVISKNEYNDIISELKELGDGKPYQPIKDVEFTCWDINDKKVFVDFDNLVYQDNIKIYVISLDDTEYERNASRIVRQIMTRLLEDDGYLGFHSSMFELDGKGYVVPGDSGSGKSTFSLAVPSFLKNAKWIGNDRVYVKRTDSGLVATAFPLPLAINYGSLAALEITNYSQFNLRSETPTDETDWKSYNGEEKMKVSNREVKEILSIDVGTVAPVAGFVFPSVDINGVDYFCRKADFEEIKPTLLRNSLAINDNLFPEDWLGIRQKQSNPQDDLDKLMDVINTLDLYRCETSKYEHTRKVVQKFYELTLL